MEEIYFHSILSSYGDIVELDYKFEDDAINQLKKINNWLPGPNNKKGINLTGPIDDLQLDAPSKIKHQKNQTANENLIACPSIKTFFDLWTDLGKCRAANMNKGSFFRLHRDAYKLKPQMRIFIPLNKTKDDEWIFIYDGQVQRFKSGVPYILNTRKPHGSFAMANDIYHVLMHVALNKENLLTVANLLPNCIEN